MENNLVKLEPCPFCGCRDRRVGIRRRVTTDIEFVARSAEVSDLMYQ